MQEIAKDDFIPESLFYMLGMKANNETALRFQKWLAFEVIPSIRKTGSYGIVEVSEGTELSRKERIKIAEVIATSPQYNLKAVIDVLKEFLSPDVVEVYMQSNHINSNTTMNLKMKVASDFPSKLIELMCKNGMNQKELANATGIWKSSISQYCNGKAKPRKEKLMVLAKTLNVNIDYFLNE